MVMALVVTELEKGLSDVLGDLYMSLDLGNERLGQFFTPFDVSKLTAQMTLDEALQRLERQLYITLAEPTCGSGGMILAFADAMREHGANYQKALHVSAQDIDITSVHMTYIQLSLAHIPALVVHGDTLTLEQRDVWATPAHILGGWEARLRTDVPTAAASGS
jgi:type I restriction-modification system DNA methylase subunit